MNKQVTLGHIIVADGWAGASNPNPHPNPPPTLKHTYQLDGCFQWTNGRTDKASYRVACPQKRKQKRKKNRKRSTVFLFSHPQRKFNSKVEERVKAIKGGKMRLLEEKEEKNVNKTKAVCRALEWGREIKRNRRQPDSGHVSSDDDGRYHPP